MKWFADLKSLKEMKIWDAYRQPLVMFHEWCRRHSEEDLTREEQEWLRHRTLSEAHDIRRFLEDE